MTCGSIQRVTAEDRRGVPSGGRFTSLLAMAVLAGACCPKQLPCPELTPQVYQAIVGDGELVSGPLSRAGGELALGADGPTLYAGPNVLTEDTNFSISKSPRTDEPPRGTPISVAIEVSPPAVSTVKTYFTLSAKASASCPVERARLAVERQNDVGPSPALVWVYEPVIAEGSSISAPLVKLTGQRMQFVCVDPGGAP